MLLGQLYYTTNPLQISAGNLPVTNIGNFVSAGLNVPQLVGVRVHLPAPGGSDPTATVTVTINNVTLSVLSLANVNNHVELVTLVVGQPLSISSVVTGSAGVYVIEVVY